MNPSYPETFATLGQWASSQSIPMEEARRRYAQYIILCSIASIPMLRTSLVFKGGNALDFVYLRNRSTMDLDFTLDMASPRGLANHDTLRQNLSLGMARQSQRHGLRLAIHSIRNKPPGTGKTFATIETRIGYALPDQQHLMLRMDKGQPSPQMVPVEISLNDPVYDAAETRLHQSVPLLRVCTLEDIVAEKLRALLQQPIRNRNRRQDVLDLAVILSTFSDINPAHVAEALIIKATARDVPVSRRAFHAPAISEHARVDYGELAFTTRNLFIPFDEAFARILSFVETLDIPRS